MALTQEEEEECKQACIAIGTMLLIGFVIISGFLFYTHKVLLPRAITLGDHLLTKLGHNWDDVFRCKLNLAEHCNGQMKEELKKQHKLHNQYKDRLTELARDEWPSYFVVHDLAPNVTKFVDYHQTTQVDICGFDETCTKCLHECVNSWSKRNYTCTSENAWKVIQYSPEKEN